MTPPWIAVVAGAIKSQDGCWLMHRRPPEKHHGGLWEFPGGKVEPTEIPIESLVRELREELNITIQQVDCSPIGFAQECATVGSRPIVILLYKISDYEGNPVALEGGEIGWFTPSEIAALDKPPLDVELASQLFMTN